MCIDFYDVEIIWNKLGYYLLQTLFALPLSFLSQTTNIDVFCLKDVHVTLKVMRQSNSDMVKLKWPIHMQKKTTKNCIEKLIMQKIKLKHPILLLLFESKMLP